MDTAKSIIAEQCCVVENFLTDQLSDHYFREIHRKVQWTQPVINLFGRRVPSPRLAAWYGDRDAVYQYSGLKNEPLKWFSELLELRGRIQDVTGCAFNSVLVNLYRCGKDSMGRHSDNEPELGREPVIASVSLGGTRRFVLKHKRRKDISPISIPLHNGSLLIMKGKIQQDWYHSVPKTKKPVSERINLTYRFVHPS